LLSFFGLPDPDPANQSQCGSGSTTLVVGWCIYIGFYFIEIAKQGLLIWLMLYLYYYSMKEAR
jgi:hypothetical protein